MTSTPTCEAISLTDETIPCLPRTGGRDAASETGVTSGTSTGLIEQGAVISDSSSVRLSNKENVFRFFIKSFLVRQELKVLVIAVVIADMVFDDVNENI